MHQEPEGQELAMHQEPRLALVVLEALVAIRVEALGAVIWANLPSPPDLQSREERAEPKLQHCINTLWDTSSRRGLLATVSGKGHALLRKEALVTTA